MPQNPDEMARTMIANLPQKTGKSLPQWLAIVAKSKPAGRLEDSGSFNAMVSHRVRRRAQPMSTPNCGAGRKSLRRRLRR